MRDRARYAVGVVAILCVTVLATAAVVLTLPTSRELSIAELRAGTDFALGPVRLTQTRFVDNQNGPVVDGGYVVAFLIMFPNGSAEDLEFSFDGYCPARSVNEHSSAHRGPAAVFRHVCGQDFIRVVVVG